jgi:ankyrin repeat protein
VLARLQEEDRDGAGVRRAIIAAAGEDNRELLRRLLTDRDKTAQLRPALNKALATALVHNGGPQKAREGVLETVVLLLKAGADPNAIIGAGDRFGGTHMGRTPLCFAAAVHWPGLIDLLLKAGADVNATSEKIDGGNPDAGGAALMVLAAHASYTNAKEQPDVLRTARLLLAAKADMHKENSNGLSALLLGLGNKELTALFLKSGARVNAATGSGWTPLTFAAKDTNYRDSIPLLLAAGARPAQADGKGRLPLQVAEENGNGKAAVLLQAALAGLGKKKN